MTRSGESSVSEESQVKSKWTTRRKLLGSLALLIAAIMVVILPGIFWELHKANKALRAFSVALIAKQYDRAYDFTSPELRAVTGYPTFVKVHDGLTLRFGDLQNVEVDESSVKDRNDAWYATVETQMIFARGSVPFVFVLKKENGSWKIYSYHEQ